MKNNQMNDDLLELEMEFQYSVIDEKYFFKGKIEDLDFSFLDKNYKEDFSEDKKKPHHDEGVQLYKSSKMD